MSRILLDLGYERSTIDPSLFYLFTYDKNNEENKQENKNEKLNELIIRKRRSWMGVIGHSLLEYIPKSIIKRRRLRGFLCVHVDD